MPPSFVDSYMDARLCPRLVNVVLNVTDPIGLFGIGQIANPAAAHGDYDNDARVIALIAHGLDTARAAAMREQGCRWLETR